MEYVTMLALFGNLFLVGAYFWLPPCYHDVALVKQQKWMCCCYSYWQHPNICYGQWPTIVSHCSAQHFCISFVFSIWTNNILTWNPKPRHTQIKTMTPLPGGPVSPPPLANSVLWIALSVFCICTKFNCFTSYHHLHFFAEGAGWYFQSAAGV